MTPQLCCVALGMALTLGAAVDAWAGGSTLVSHRAVYEMTLNSTKLGSGVTGASGKMIYRFADACDGWTVENRTILTFSYNDGAPADTTWDFVTWESKDGLRYRFRVHSTRNGVVSEEIDGTAALEGVGKGGAVKFSLPEPRTIRLPRGTLFPTEHTVRLLDAAAKGGHMLSRSIFDGTGTEGFFDVSALIGKMLPAHPKNDDVKPGINAGLLSGPSWPMQLAFFPQDSMDPTPDYEISLHYYQNGIADEILQSFGTFSLKGTLLNLELLPRPDC